MPSFQPCILEKGTSVQLERKPRGCRFTLWLADVRSAPMQYLWPRDPTAMIRCVPYLEYGAVLETQIPDAFHPRFKKGLLVILLSRC